MHLKSLHFHFIS